MPIEVVGTMPPLQAVGQRFGDRFHGRAASFRQMIEINRVHPELSGRFSKVEIITIRSQSGQESRRRVVAVNLQCYAPDSNQKERNMIGRYLVLGSFAILVSGCVIDEEAISPNNRPDGQTTGQTRGTGLSPVPDMKAWGKDWTLDVKSIDGKQHSAQMTIPDSSGPWMGTLNYHGTPQGAPAGLVSLNGEMRQGIAMLQTIVTLTPGNCSAEGRTGTHKVTVNLTDGKPLQGCANVAVY
ncbi:hypothetical protein H4P12_12295 [Paracoccus sp. 11-3]|uniref:Uncharacterized protein n=1 Tax=Paracoccus amoyensis TaxID=2760093 RepID=A0A926GHL6_9RHOB|nr:hypothetical protein [Paracoccus amoyensis]MBC9247474.1 hypothetical protein [Paracoccus amoyensis]